ncbi:MAG: MBL fold metallo-hydrolase [Daejeonella sp.]
MDRRKFVQTTGMSLAMMALFQNKGVAAFLDDEKYKFKILRNDIGIFTEQGGTIAWMSNPEGVVVVDSQFPEPAGHLIAELKKRSTKPFKLLINTHHHGDHTSGNIAFKGLAEHVVAHENSLANQKRVAQAQNKEETQLYPDLTFKDKWEKNIGNENIKAQYFGAAHTNGDSIIHFQNANIAHMGDLVFNRRFPFIDKSAGASISNWSVVLEEACKYYDNDTLFIFGHAAEPENVTGNKADLKAMQNYLDKLLLYVNTEIKAGKSKEEILKAEMIPGADDFKGQGIERSLTAAYEELTAQ